MLKVLNYNKKDSIKILEVFLNKRKTAQKSQTKVVGTIIKKVKKKGDIAVLNYEKKFSKLKIKSNKIFFSKKEIINISKKLDKKIKKAIDLAYSRIKKFHS
jgi:histidinol dehydrogenase